MHYSLLEHLLQPILRSTPLFVPILKPLLALTMPDGPLKPALSESNLYFARCEAKPYLYSGRNWHH